MVCGAHREWGLRFQQLHPRFPALSPIDSAPAAAATAAPADSAGGGSGAAQPRRLEVDLSPDRPLVVGYVSPDFFTHSVSYFAEAPLSKHR